MSLRTVSLRNTGNLHSDSCVLKQLAPSVVRRPSSVAPLPLPAPLYPVLHPGTLSFPSGAPTVLVHMINRPVAHIYSMRNRSRRLYRERQVQGKTKCAAPPVWLEVFRSSVRCNFQPVLGATDRPTDRRRVHVSVGHTRRTSPTSSWVLRRRCRPRSRRRPRSPSPSSLDGWGARRR